MQLNGLCHVDVDVIAHLCENRATDCQKVSCLIIHELYMFAMFPYLGVYVCVHVHADIVKLANTWFSQITLHNLFMSYDMYAGMAGCCYVITVR